MCGAAVSHGAPKACLKPNHPSNQGNHTNGPLTEIPAFCQRRTNSLPWTADTATGTADTATGTANTATGTANTATQTANTATREANTATGTADTPTTASPTPT
ncbi:alanine-zipper protein [Prauserella oleivorans]|uniref:Alanine-zipper protein n=1 Tax=Prauserella oleivorans TaxID=1478153 RepID=A0ABW5W696_9PSEU